MKFAIYVSNNNHVTGPFTKKALREAVHSGQFSRDDWAWHKDLPDWTPVHAVIPIIYISRAGEVIGEFEDERDILQGLRSGTLLMDDCCWCEGMSDWKCLSELKISHAALATEAQKGVLRAAGLPFNELTTKAEVSALLRSDGDLPASAKQLALLQYLGRPVSANLTRRDVSKIIDGVIGDRDRSAVFGEWQDDKLLLFPDVFADEIVSRKKQCLSDYNSLWRPYYGRNLSEEEADRIFAYLDANKPGWMKPREHMYSDHFVPCVKAKLHKLA